MEYSFFQGIGAQLDEAYKVRFRVFVDDQQVPAEIEKDEFDQCAWHVLAIESGTVVGTGRVFADPDVPGIVRLGRVAVLPEWRGNGVGRGICERLIEKGRQMGAHKVVIHAQVQVEKLYEKIGFVSVGDIFAEAGIDHIEMIFLIK